jgi:hypothetical protein
MLNTPDGSYMSPGEAAELVEEWVGRLDRFCAALEQQGFRVERNGLSVRIDPPAAAERDRIRQQIERLPSTLTMLDGDLAVVYRADDLATVFTDPTKAG